MSKQYDMKKKSSSTNSFKDSGYKKNRKPGKRSNQGKESYSAKSEAIKDYNDPSWYVFNSEVAEAAYTFPFVPFTGTPFSMDDSANSSLCPPVLATVNIAPTGGEDKGINYVARKTFTELSAYNSKTTQYQPQDITIILLALGSVLEMWNYVTRTYRWGVSFNMRNKAIPTAFMNACNMDYEDFKLKIAVYNGRLLTIMNNINRIPWPMNFDWFKVCATTHVHMFVDDPSSPMTQYYITRPDGYWTLDEAYDAQGSGLAYTKINYPAGGVADKTMDDWIDILDSMIEAINMSTTFNSVFADVVRYLETNTNVPHYHVALEDLTTAPSAIFSPEWNLMLNNASMVDVVENDVSCDVDKNNVVFHRNIRVSPVSAGSQIVNFPMPQPSINDRIAALKYMIGANIEPISSNFGWDTPLFSIVSKNGLTSDEFIGIGDHVITEMSIRNGTETNVVIGKVFNSTAWMPDNMGTVESEPSLDSRRLTQIMTLCDMSKFTAMPRVYFTRPVGGSQKFKIADTFGDLNYYATIDAETLDRAKYVNAISLFEMQTGK